MPQILLGLQTKLQTMNKSISLFLGKIKSNIEFRTKLFLFISLIFNFGYSIFLIIASIIYLSKWFLVMSIYYVLLSLARVIIFFKITPKTTLQKKILIMRACGYFLLLLNLVVSAMIFLLIFTAPSTIYHEIIVITLATHTFSSLTISIINIVKYLKKNNYIYSCVKAISLISASVSMLTLTNTMLATFGSDNTLLRRIILPILSSVVAIFIVTCAILMIKKANNDLKVLKND